MKKIGQFSEAHISKGTSSNLVFQIVNMKGIKYVNLIEINPVVTEI